jgi:hypothetical protein
VIALTARPRDATSSRTVIEYETLGAMVTWIPALLPAGAVGRWNPSVRRAARRLKR